MTTPRARLAAVALATVCLTMAFVPLASARPEIAPSAPRLESYDALLSAKGSLEIVFSSHKLRECSPGYDVTTKVLAKFDTGQPVQVTFSAMYAKKGKPPIFLSSATASGKSTTTGAFLD